MNYTHYTTIKQNALWKELYVKKDVH